MARVSPPSIWGLVTNAHSAMQAAVLVQQLVDTGTRLPVVVFNRNRDALDERCHL